MTGPIAADATAANGTVTIVVDGTALTAPAGTTLTAALIGAGRWRLRTHPLTGEPRGPLCGMGVCLECEVTVDGRPGIRACLVRITDAMRVATSAGTP